MPAYSGTTAVLTLSGGAATFVPPRFSATAPRLTLTGGTGAFSVGSDTSLSVTTPELDRMTSFDQLFNANGTPALRMMSIWQDTMERIEEAFAALTTQVSDNSTIIARLVAAEALAAAASATAQEIEDRDTLTSSYPSPTNVLSAANTGTITISAHSRVYGDGTSVSVNSGSVTGFANGDYVTVYYDDAGRTGGAVTYVGTTNAVGQAGARHVLGSVTIPPIGDPVATGTTVSAPGYIPLPGGGSREYDF